MSEVVNLVFGLIVSALISYLLWTVRRYQTKVDELDIRVTKVEIIMTLLGDIKSDLNTVKTDVEVIKAKLNP